MAIQKNRKNQQACIISDDLQQLLDVLRGANEVCGSLWDDFRPLTFNFFNDNIYFSLLPSYNFCNKF